MESSTHAAQATQDEELAAGQLESPPMDKSDTEATQQLDSTVSTVALDIPKMQERPHSPQAARSGRLLNYQASNSGLSGLKKRIVRVTTGTTTRHSKLLAWAETDEDLSETKIVGRIFDQDGCGQRFVMKESNRFRQIWGIVVALLLVYTGTFFPYKLIFLEFRMSDDAFNSDDYFIFELIVDILFWADLVIIFFFSFRNQQNREVLDMRKIAERYVMTWFIINLIACIPPDVFKVISGGAGASDMNKGLRLTRLHRTTRLARLVRLARLAKFAPFLRESTIWKYIQTFRGIRMMNMTLLLFWIAHMLACGWYLCAALHNDHSITWVGRRIENVSKNDSLLTSSPGVQWAHSMYFVLTVFTTVGFGDISAFTTGEILYVSLVMIVGTVVNSIIVSEVITIITGVDRAQAELNKQFGLIEDFADHAQLRPKVTAALEQVVKKAMKRGTISRVDHSDMKAFFNGQQLPRTMLGKLPQELFQGKLVSNKFIADLSKLVVVPPRLSLTLAAAMEIHQYDRKDTLYQNSDHPVHIFLVQSGTFANVGVPNPNGGSNPIPASVISKASLWRTHTNNFEVARDGQELFPYQLFGHGNYFGDYELFLDADVRSSYVRCEAPGSVLAVHRKDVKEIRHEYPSFITIWEKSAVARESHRKRMLRRLTEKQAYSLFAVLTIQRWFQENRVKVQAFSKSRGVALAKQILPKDAQRMADQTKFFSKSNGSTAFTCCGTALAEIAELRSEVSHLRNSMGGLQETLDQVLWELRGQKNDKAKAELR
eukprot:TRINITY_DN4375_c0_g1_i4.p1 TRINITY_DN4375_c0_g1~~TRINITY_DN4375_c0_g1_i4.p1  ORF type:complete len:771 (+),score=138.48 TRINITY_DN4375_c0_g1_i4:34-2346(+)